MAIIQKITYMMKKKFKFVSHLDTKALRIHGFNPVIIVSSLIIFSCIYFVSLNLIEKKTKENLDNIQEITKNNEFSKFSNFLISKMNSPYEEINYIIRNNDTVEKILKKFKINNTDIKNISTKLKQKKLANIYSGRKLILVIKKLKDGSRTIVHFVYPISNTSSVEIRKTKDNFLVKENILQLYKKEVVVKNVIKNNLYSSAVETGVEPNIIIELNEFLGLR